MSRKYAQLVELLEAQGVMQTDQPWAEPVIAFIKSNRKTGNGQQYRESAELDTLRTANQRLEGEVKALREALETAMTSMLDSGYNSKSAVIQNCKAALRGTGEQP